MNRNIYPDSEVVSRCQTALFLSEFIATEYSVEILKYVFIATEYSVEI